MKDILLNTDLTTPSLKDGDFAVGHSDSQHVALLAHTEKGEWRFHPLAGMGLADGIQDDASPTALRHTVVTQITADGGKLSGLTIGDDGKITINAYYP